MWSISLKAKGKRQKAKGKDQSYAFKLASAIRATVPCVTAGRRSAKLLLPFAFCRLPFAFSSSACRQDMHDQPKYKPYAPSSFFDDNRSSRPLVEGTVPRGSLSADSPLARV